MYRWVLSTGLLFAATTSGCQTLGAKSKNALNLTPSTPPAINAARPSAGHTPHVVIAAPPTGRYDPRLLDPQYGGSTSGSCSTGVRGAGRG